MPVFRRYENSFPALNPPRSFPAGGKGLGTMKPFLPYPSPKGGHCSSAQCSRLDMAPASPQCCQRGLCVTPSHSPICSRAAAVSLPSEMAPDLWERQMKRELEMPALRRITVVGAPRGFIRKLLQQNQIKATLCREDRHPLISWLSASPSLLAHVVWAETLSLFPLVACRDCPCWSTWASARGMGKWPQGNWACQALSCNSSTLCFIKNFFPAWLSPEGWRSLVLDRKTYT